MEFTMNNIVYSCCLLIALSVTPNNADAQQCEASSIGTSFIFGIIGYIGRVTGTNIKLHLVPTTGQTPAHVRVTVPFTNFDNSYTVSNYTVVPLNGILLQYEAGQQFKGIEVNSDVNITLTVVTVNGDITEGFLALPVTALGIRYIAASYRPYSSYSSEILIAGVESDTDVILNTLLNGHTDSSLTFRLQKFETYQFKSNNDVSGSVITSNKPVAVFSGSADAQIPVGVGDFQYIVEQMIPTKYWTTKFIIPPIYPRKYFVIKTFTDHDNTEVHFYNSTRHFAIYLKKGSIEELLFGTDPVVIVADKPVSVIQYGHDGDNMDGDPFMANAQGISQFQDSYQFATQNYFSGSNTIAITVRKTDTSELRLNGHPMSYWNAKNISVAHPMEEYVVVFVNVSYDSYFRLYHTRGVKFGAVIYGRYVNTVAYGYPLQLSFKEPTTDCEYQPASATTTDAYTPTTVATTHVNQTSNGNGSKNWCFSCDSMTHLKYCNEVTRCRNENEVCFVQRYTRNLHIQQYKSGCIEPEKCNSGDGSDGCTECCTGDFCNSVGCGDKGFQTLGQRGPLCFDCTHKGADEDCNTVQLCHSDQMCMIEMYEWGDESFHHIMGCTQSQVCTRKRSIAGVSVRHAPVCAHCCHSDFCNINCTSVNTAPAIVG